MTALAVKTLRVDDEVTARSCFDVFTHLRPELTLDEFQRQIGLQYAEGYRIVYLEHEGRIVAAAGYRYLHFLAWGKSLYLDDLITLPEARGQGWGGKLMDWLVNEGQGAGCRQLHLDTGHHRHDAHKLYLRKGLRLACHHMAMDLPDTVARSE
jgi:GNAT superfamily N-acetyltransferase